MRSALGRVEHELYEARQGGSALLESLEAEPHALSFDPPDDHGMRANLHPGKLFRLELQERLFPHLAVASGDEETPFRQIPRQHRLEVGQSSDPNLPEEGNASRLSSFIAHRVL